MPPARRIQFLYTGGTIGMVPSPRGFEPGGDIHAHIQKIVHAQNTPAGLDLGFAQLREIVDSSNITPDHWQEIIDHLRAHRDGYDGFVVLHGTNTLAHSAAAVALALTGFDRPVVFTGSQIPFGMPGSDAVGNVIGALTAAAGGTSGVSLYFDNTLLSGTRATKISALDAHGFINPYTEQSDAPRHGRADPAPYRRHDVAVVTLAPGITAARFRAMTTPAPDAVILRAYGAGEGPSDEPELEQAIGDLVAAGTPVVVMSQCLHTRIDLTKYAAAQFLHRCGAIGAHDMSLEAVYAKLQFLLSQGIPADQIGTWLHTNMAGELTPDTASSLSTAVRAS
ncbi:asparaginase [Streptomyces coffeae]|uniref:Asparaginase n=1 Tax=Streptomyces coffeae TaxID=621382 RepID=A0ABS1NNA8_9ACTN|nr:asparaginase [Streptomyces coffeae]MBL1101551.1 asparaginase [Streptomyces coffeae]